LLYTFLLHTKSVIELMEVHHLFLHVVVLDEPLKPLVKEE